MNLRCMALIMPRLHPSAYEECEENMVTRFGSSCVRHVAGDKSLSKRQRQRLPLLLCPSHLPSTSYFSSLCVCEAVTMATSPKAAGKCVGWGGGGLAQHRGAHLFFFCLTENMNMKGQICFRLHIRFAVLFCQV